MNKEETIEQYLKKDRVYRNFQSFNIIKRDNNEENDNSEKEYVVEGVACVFDKPTVLFEYDGIEYNEVVDRNAFNDADITDVIFNYNHHGRVFARTRNDSLHLEVKEDGLHIRLAFDPDDQGHMQLYRDIQKGLIDRMSYAYTITPDGEEYDKETHTIKVMKIKKLYDVSAVDIPAYDTTSIYARSLIELDSSFKEKLDNDARKNGMLQRQRIAKAIELELYLVNQK